MIKIKVFIDYLYVLGWQKLKKNNNSLDVVFFQKDRKTDRYQANTSTETKSFLLLGSRPFSKVKI